MRGLTGKNVVVTGAASGIGRASAARLLEEGARVLGADITARRTTGPAPTGTPDAWAFTAVDVSDEGSVAAMVAEAVRLFGRIDGVVNAAGVAGGGAVHMVDVAEWRRVVDVNLFGTYLVAKHVLTQMLGQDLVDGARGSVVTIASIEGIEGTAGGSAYSASKGGVVILTKNMAIDYAGRGIRVNTVCPGFIDTPMTAEYLRPGGYGDAAPRDHQGAQARPLRPARGDRLGRLPSCCRVTLRSSPATHSSSTVATRPVATTASPRCWVCLGRSSPAAHPDDFHSWAPGSRA